MLAFKTRIRIRSQGCKQLFRVPSSAPVSSLMRKKELPPNIIGSFLFQEVDRIEPSKEPEPVPSAPGKRMWLCPPSPTADNPLAPPSPTSSSQIFLPVHWMPASRCQLLYCTSFGVMYGEVKNVFFFIFLFLMYYLLFMKANHIQLLQSHGLHAARQASLSFTLSSLLQICPLNW